MVVQEQNRYLATKGAGLVIWPKEKDIYSINVKHGLLSNQLEDVETGVENTVWTASLNGINKIDISGDQDYKVKSFTTAHGLPVPDIYDLEWYDGELYAATGKGVIVLSDDKKNEISSTPIFTDFKVNGDSYDSDSFYIFTHEQNNIEIKYLTINHKMDGKINYSYKLTTKTKRQTENREVDFVDLKPNDYTFRISSQNEDGFWSDEAVITFRISQAWYKTYWFYGLVALSFIGLIFLLYRYRTNQLKKEMALQNEMRSLEKAALKSQMNPHFIFNCLNSIQNFIIQNDKLSAMNYLTKFAHLIRLTLNASMEKEISLEDETKILEDYLALEKLRFKNKFDYEIFINPSINLLETYLPPLLIQPIVENAIKHGMKEIQADGRIMIKFEKLKSKLKVTIRDNGLGFSKKTNEKGHKSLGMRITNKRLEHESQLGQNVKVERIDGWTVVEILI